MERAKRNPNRWRAFVPGVVLAAVAMAAALILGSIDAARSANYQSIGKLLVPDASGASWTLALVGTAEGTAIAIVIVVVVLGVQLTADRYSPRIIDIFVGDRFNTAVLALFLGSIVYTILVSATVKTDYVPLFAVYGAMALAVADFSILLPYVRHMFSVMRAESIITSIEGRAARTLAKAAAGPARPECRHEIRDALAQITDIALGSIQEGDTEVCLTAIESLRELMVRDYVPIKSHLQASWFTVDSVDLPGGSEQIIAQVDRTRTWVEHTVLSDLLDLIGETPAFRKEVIHAIARATRALGEAAIAVNDHDLEVLVIRFFNTYLRAAMNQRAAPFAYAIFNEYRAFAVRSRNSRPELLLRVAEHLLGYGRSFDAAGMPFIIGTAGEDVATMIQTVAEEDFDRALLLTELTARNLRQMVPIAQPIALNGMLKAAIKLTLWSLATGHDQLTAVLLEAIREVPSSLTEDALQRMELTREGVFYEVSDRVVAFDWVEPDLRELIPALRLELSGQALKPARTPRRPVAAHS